MVQRAGISVSVRGRLGNERGVKREAGQAFRLLLLGNFSGRLQKPSLERPRRVDITELEQLFEPFAAQIEAPTLDGGVEVLRPRSLEDLHPDALLGSVRALAEGSELMRALSATSVGSDTLARVRAYLSRFGETPRTAAPSAETAEPGDANTLQRLLGKAPAAAPPERPNLLSALLEDAVRGHKVDPPSGEREALKAALLAVVSEGLTRVLQTPAFRELEANWRGADRVVRALDTDEELEIRLLDISLPELVSRFGSGADPEQTDLHRLLIQSEEPWTLLAAAFQFGNSDAELTALAGLGALAARASGALVADAAPALLGCDKAAELAESRLWSERAPSSLFHAIRESPLGKHIGLVLPRVLARARYGKKAEPVETLAFEELNSTQGVARVWSSGAFAVAELVGRAFRESGWGFSERLELTLKDLPCETIEREGEHVLVQPIEASFDQRTAELILSRGVMPFIGQRDEASLRLLQLASIAEPRAPLAGVDSDA
jgi:type VI secretion system protein ImpC